MSIPATYSFSAYQGDTLTFDVTYKEGDSGSEVGVSLTGATLLSQIRTSRDATSSTTTMTCTADADQTTYPGKMLVTLPAANSALLTGSLYLYDIQVTWTDSTVQTILQGAITPVHDISEV